MKGARIEVLSLWVHAALAFAVLISYTVLAAMGHPDETLKYALMVIVSSFFGTVTAGALKSTPIRRSTDLPPPPVETPVQPAPTVQEQQQQTNTHA